MGSQLLSILRQGVWASITGGWFYDQRQSHFSNLFHLYIWLFLLCFPLVIQFCIKSYTDEEDRLIVWSVYCITIAIIFSIIKAINAYLHHLFDTGECVIDKDETDHEKIKNVDLEKSSDCFQSIDLPSSIFEVRGQNSNGENFDNAIKRNKERFEMVALRCGRIADLGKEEENGDRSNEKGNEAYSNMVSSETGLNSGVIDLEVDVHHRNSSGSSIAACGSISSLSATSGRLADEKAVISECSSRIQDDFQENNSAKNDNICDSNEKDLPQVPRIGATISALSLSNDSSSDLTTQSASLDVLMKGTFYGELGFKTQDPNVMRNIAGCRAGQPMSTFKPNRINEIGLSGRRARSELASKNYFRSDKKVNQTNVSSIPPSHPVSLEIIGCNCDSTDLVGLVNDKLHSGNKSSRFSSVEILNHSRPSAIMGKTKSASVISEAIKPIDEISSDETGPHQNDNDKVFKNKNVIKDLAVKKSKTSAGRHSKKKQNSKHTGAKVVKKSPVKSNAKNIDNNVVHMSLEESSNCSSDEGSWGNGSSSTTESGSDVERQQMKDILQDSELAIKLKSNTKNDSNNPNFLPIEVYELYVQLYSIPLIKNICIREIAIKRLKAELEIRKVKSQLPTKFYNDLRMIINKIDQAYTVFPLNKEECKRLLVSEVPLPSNLLTSTSSATSEGPPAYLLARILAKPGTHLAKTHDDTTTGAVHCFQDEKGNWLTYIFDENSMGTAKEMDRIMNSESKYFFETYSQSSDKCESWSSSSESAVILGGPSNIIHTPGTNENENESEFFAAKIKEVKELEIIDMIDQPRGINSIYNDSYSNPYSPLNRAMFMDSNIQERFSPTSNSNNLNEIFPIQPRFNGFASSKSSSPKPKQYYKLWWPPYLRWNYIKVRFERLDLMTLLDRSLTEFELFSSIVLAVLVAILGSIVIEKGFFNDLYLVLFCFVMCSSQYTLLKSVQPDAASPTHGYNRIIIYSRPIYFSVICSLILLVRWYLDNGYNLCFKLYGINVLDRRILKMVEECGKIMVLSFPIIFSLGLLPQIDTFIMYLIEQIDIHIFGGTALTMGLGSAMYSIIRSISIVLLLFIFALTSLARININTFTYHQYDVLFSVFCGFLVYFSYFLSRQTSDPTVVCNLLKKYIYCNKTKLVRQDKDENLTNENETCEAKKCNDKDDKDDDEEECEKEYIDPLPKKLEKTLLMRLENDLILSLLVTVVVFAIHVSTIFTLQPYVENILGLTAIVLGFLLHYLFVEFRKELPWLSFSSPILKPKEYGQYEVKGEATLMWFEQFFAWLSMLEKNVIYPLIFLSALTKDTPLILEKFGLCPGTLIMVICAFKSIRATFNDASHNHLILLFSYLVFEYDLSHIKEAFLINYALISIIYSKMNELLLKIRFVVTYVAPWQISWGSAFHAFAQPFSVPHSGMLFIQALISSILSSPLEPVLGSAIFLASYVRPIKFWERDYNTKRIDYSNTRLVTLLERNSVGGDDNNLNSIFYEHLTRSLQHSLYGDLALGRWGPVSQGDCFVLASENLNFLVHIIELGNGLVTFQVRGLEFRGTYCQQREVEAISEGINENEGCCCFKPGHLPSMLSVNAAFNQRWLAWEVTHSKYVLEGYSITDNPALHILQAFELRKALMTYYVKSLIYYTVGNNKLEKWLKMDGIREVIDNITYDSNFVDLDPIFTSSVDEDYYNPASGITRSSFLSVYGDWISYCCDQRKTTDDREAIMSLCFSLSLLARRALSTASHHNSYNSVEFLLYGLHSLFKGDFRITSPRDEWVFQDIDLLKKVIAPSVRMAVKLHQDHFTSSEEYADNVVLYASIANFRKSWVISHETDPIWRNALLSNVPSLLALRHVYDDGTNSYKIIMLNIRHLSFRVIKINRECVRGLWAGQQQELVYLRNRDTERGSIQNAKQALRNIINSSCDQPIGYPIYVSPLITSFSETSTQYCSVVGKPLSFSIFKTAALNFWSRLRRRCGEGCSSGGGEVNSENIIYLRPMNSINSNRRPLHDAYTLDRNRGAARSSRGSHCTDKSLSEYESCQLLSRKAKTFSGHGHVHAQTDKNARRLSSSAMMNLSRDIKIFDL